MNLTSEQIEFYKKLKTQLEDTTTFPCTYLYKFILPNEVEKKRELEAIIRSEEKKITDIFASRKAKISSKLSSSGKYESFSIEIWVSDADKVIEIYQKVGEIDGVLSL